MAARRSAFFPPPARLSAWFARSAPLVLLLLVPVWITLHTVEDPEPAAASPVFFHPPDLVDDPVRVLPALAVGPLVHTKLDQTQLVTAQLVLFGIAVERRLGRLPAFGLYWGTSAAAAVFAGAVLLALDAAFPDTGAVSAALDRVYSGGSVGGYGLAGALAALLPWRWRLPLVAAIVLWEFGAWYQVLRNFTPLFHGAGFVAGYAAALLLARRQGEAAARM